MAKYKDPYLKQIVDDLNILNAATIPAPLTVEQCELSNVVEDLSHGGQINTRATLTIPVADANYPAGSMTVYYRRLDVNTLTSALSHNVGFVGPEAQSKTLGEILTKFAPGLASYLLPDLLDEGPYDLTRDSSQITLTAKEDSSTFIGSITLSVFTDLIDISLWQQQMSSFFFKESVPADQLTYNADINQEVLNRVVTAAGYPGIVIPAADITMTLGVDFPGGIGQAYVEIDMAGNSTFKGSNKFYYARLTASSTFGVDPFILVSDETDHRTFILKCYESVNSYPMKLPANMGQVHPRLIGTAGWQRTAPAEDDPLYLAGNSGYVGFQQNPLTAIPYEAVFDFTLSTAGVKQFLTGQHQSGPTSFDILSGPAGAPASMALDANGLTLSSLPAGNYNVRVTAADSRTVSHGSFNVKSVAYSPALGITRVRSLKGVNHQEAFLNCTTLTTVDATVFSAAGAFAASTVYSIDGIFRGCTALTSIPAGLFDALTRCEYFDRAFQDSGLTALPTMLFKDQKALFSDNRTAIDIIKGTPITTLPSSVFHNVEGFTYMYVFRNAANLATVPADVFSGTHKVTPAWQYNFILGLTDIFSFPEAFLGTALTSIPADLFSAFKNQPYECDFDSTFEGTPITSIPVGLFAFIPLFTKYPEAASTPTFELHQTFANCLSLTSIPAGFFDNVPLRYPGWTFKGSNVAAIPAGLLNNFPGLKYTVGLFMNTKITSIPAGLFNGSTGLKNASSMFEGCTLLTTVPSALLGNQPELFKVDGTFAGCLALGSVPADLFTNSPVVQDITRLFARTNMTTVPASLFQPFAATLKTAESLFFNSPELTTIPAGLFANTPNLDYVSYMFSSCAKLSSVPANLFGASNSKILYLTAVFRDCTLLTTVPANVFAGLTAVTDVSQLFLNSGLTALPASIFDSFISILTTVRELCANAVNFATLPVGVLAGGNLITDYSSAFANTAVVNPPTGIFPASNVACSCQMIFYNAKVKNIPAGFFGMKNITNLYRAFQFCPLETVGDLIVNNTQAATLDVTQMFDAPFDPKPTPVFGNNVIVSTIPLTLTGSGNVGGGPFGVNTNIAANVNDAFGDFIRIGSKAFFAGLPALHGSGANFITTHDVANAANKNGIFKDCVGLSDYGSLPAYATTFP